jgi:hypothetical protein
MIAGPTATFESATRVNLQEAAALVNEILRIPNLFWEFCSVLGKLLTKKALAIHKTNSTRAKS